MKLVRRADQPVTPWKNGGGSTRTLAVSPEGAGLDAFDWRLSVASIESDGPFSVFPEIDRTLMLIAGASLELSIDGETRVLHTPGDAVSFAGEALVHGVLRAGPTEDLNIMIRRGRFSASVEVVTDAVVNGMFVVLDPHSRVNGEPLDYGDYGVGEGLRVVGRVALVRVDG